jgi:hypothetical protein
VSIAGSFTSSFQGGHPDGSREHLNPTTAVHGVKTQKTAARIFVAVKTSKLAKLSAEGRGRDLFKFSLRGRIQETSLRIEPGTSRIYNTANFRFAVPFSQFIYSL